ncbi:MAG: sigma-70 family RNA polymerase sigma factor [Elusimicrobia bacterium]|nr:sigma-70 family RNA polymerase sigma factor [Elusimicrobiota bacterium]
MPNQDKNDQALENELIDRFMNGSQSAFAELVDLYKDRIYQFIICVLGPDREAEDIAQEVFIQIYRSLRLFKRESSFSTWAYAVTRNVCRHRLRSRGREMNLFSDIKSEIPFDAADSAPGLEFSLEAKETKAAIRAAVEALPPIYRTVLFLSCWERLSYEEIARALDIPVGTVRSRLHNAMAALAGKIKPVLDAESEVNT